MCVCVLLAQHNNTLKWQHEINQILEIHIFFSTESNRCSFYLTEAFFFIFICVYVPVMLRICCFCFFFLFINTSSVCCCFSSDKRRRKINTTHTHSEKKFLFYNSFSLIHIHELLLLYLFCSLTHIQRHTRVCTELDIHIWSTHFSNIFSLNLCCLLASKFLPYCLIMWQVIMITEICEQNGIQRRCCCFLLPLYIMLSINFI